MSEKIKIVVNKKTPKGIVNVLGNVQNKVGTYDIEKLENFKRKLIYLGEKVLFVIDKVDEVVTALTDDFFDKAIDSYERFRMKDEAKEKSIVDLDIGSYVDEVDKYVPLPEIIPTRRINFEDLEPLGKIIDDEEDIYELQELKMELLFKEQEDDKSKESGGIRKK